MLWLKVVANPNCPSPKVQLPWALVLIGIVLLAGCAAQPSFYHTVEPGQTLYRIGRAYQVDERHLARINGIDDPTNLRVGQRLYIPGASQAVAVGKNTPRPDQPGPQLVAGEKAVGPEIPATQKTAKPPPSRPQPQKAPASNSAPPAIAAEKPTTLQAPDKGRFQWPLKGQLVRSFGSAGGTLNKGIEISSPVGSAVQSAGAGRVIYSSDGVAGYGNLIIIRHDDGFFSVYGFNKKNLVSVGTFVSRGQRIALSGTPPGGGSPRLHFEIRNGKDAVNPIFYLP